MLLSSPTYPQSDLGQASVLFCLRAIIIAIAMATADLADTSRWPLSCALPWAGVFLPEASHDPRWDKVMSLGPRACRDFAQGVTPVRGWLRLRARPLGFLSPNSTDSLAAFFRPRKTEPLKARRADQVLLVLSRA